MPLRKDEFDAMTGAVLLAARATLIVRNEGASGWMKEDDTPITIADLASQAILLGEIARIRPGDRVEAEEEEWNVSDERLQPVIDVVEEVLKGSVSLGELRERIMYRGLGESGVRWFVDPIDGTKGFVKGLFYAVAVGRARGNDLLESWMAVPTGESRMEAITGRLFAARKGQGVRRFKVSDGTEERFERPVPPSGSGRLSIIASRAHDTVDLPEGVDTDRWKVELLSMDSQAKYAALAAGAAELYPRKPSSSYGAFFNWDHAAGALIVQEAGGVVTDIEGNPLDWTKGDRLTANSGIFAAGSPELHKEFQPLFEAHAKKKRK